MKRRKFNSLILKSAIVSALPFSKNMLNMPANSPLEKGDKVGLITPSGPITQQKLDNAIGTLKNLGLVPIHSKNVLLKTGYLAGDDDTRLSELHQMFSDSSIKAIWCIRGGYGATRYLDKIDFSLIKKNRKPLIGYSDVTALLNTIHQKTKNPCFHGPVAGTPFSPYTIKHLAPIFGLKSSHTIPLAEELNLRGKQEAIYQYKTIVKGSATGELVGGNLSLLVAMIGTAHAVETKNKIVFIEDVGEKPYRVDRMLTQLISSGFFDKAKGVVLGIFAGCERKDDSSFTLLEVIEDRLGSLRIPVGYGYSFGHIKHMCTLPIGAEALMDSGNGSLELLEDGY